MNFVITLTCEYIFDEEECIAYLKAIDVDPKLYEYVYKEYDHVFYMSDKRKVRKLCNVSDPYMTEYTNLMYIEYCSNYNYDVCQLPQSIQSIYFNHTNEYYYAVKRMYGDKLSWYD